ncbi:hypothetical protein [Cryobacterium sp. Y62]|uniref:hypothetical protein n=1 Tax=Cryobacterium sp. Y62 TaxID=2048284 RepID=UPI001E43FEF2|nr:hypothetical protein [Cryobacterium sp. Y62]
MDATASSDPDGTVASTTRSVSPAKPPDATVFPTNASMICTIDDLLVVAPVG